MLVIFKSVSILQVIKDYSNYGFSFYTKRIVFPENGEFKKKLVVFHWFLL